MLVDGDQRVQVPRRRARVATRSSSLAVAVGAARAQQHELAAAAARAVGTVRLKHGVQPADVRERAAVPSRQRRDRRRSTAPSRPAGNGAAIASAGVREPRFDVVLEHEVPVGRNDRDRRASRRRIRRSPAAAAREAAGPARAAAGCGRRRRAGSSSAAGRTDTGCAARRRRTRTGSGPSTPSAAVLACRRRPR